MQASQLQKRWLVLGGTGLVGSYLVNALIARGDVVDVVTRGRQALRSGARAVIADLSQTGCFENAEFGSYDAICHLAYAATGNVPMDRAVTVDSVRAVLRFAAQTRVAHVIYLGSMAVFGEDTPSGTVDETVPRLGQSDYARNKIEAAKAAMEAPGDFLASVLHPTGVYDHGSKRIKSYRAMLEAGYIDAPLTGLNNIVHAQDVASAILLCADGRQGDRREEYIINGEAMAYSDWIEVLERRFGLAGKPRLPRLVSAFCRGPLATLVCRLGWRRAISVPDYKAALYRLQTHYSFAKAEREFGYRPARFFRDEMKS